MHRKLTDNSIIFLYMKIHYSPINQVIYQFLPQYGHLSLIHVRLQKLEASDHSMGWAFQSPFLCSSVHQWPLLTYQSIIVLTKWLHGVKPSFSFFFFEFIYTLISATSWLYWIKVAIFMIIHLLQTWHFFDLLNTHSSFN